MMLWHAAEGLGSASNGEGIDACRPRSSLHKTSPPVICNYSWRAIKAIAIFGINDGAKDKTLTTKTNSCVETHTTTCDGELAAPIPKNSPLRIEKDRKDPCAK